MASTVEKEDAQKAKEKILKEKIKDRNRIMISIEKAEIETNWKELGSAPEFKWKRNLVSDAMILQELEKVRNENASMKIQVNEMKKEQDTLINLVKQVLEEIQGEKQDQNDANAKSEAGNNGRETENQRQNPPAKNARDGTKGGNTKAKATTSPPPRVVLNLPRQRKMKRKIQMKRKNAKEPGK